MGGGKKSYHTGRTLITKIQLEPQTLLKLKTNKKNTMSFDTGLNSSDGETKDWEHFHLSDHCNQNPRVRALGFSKNNKTPNSEFRLMQIKLAQGLNKRFLKINL